MPRCESRELFKGVLDGQARGIFQGKIIVRPDAQKTDGKQMAQVLMLSPDAEFDSKPEIGNLCRRRGLRPRRDGRRDRRGFVVLLHVSRHCAKAEARALLIESFIGEAIEKVEHAGVREALYAKATEWLRRQGRPARDAPEGDDDE